MDLSIISKKEFYILDHLNYNIAHHLVNANKFAAIKTSKFYSKIGELFFLLDCSNCSPILLIFKKANFEFLKYTLSELLIHEKKEDNLTNKKFKGGENILHNLILNKNIKNSQKIQIVQEMRKNLSSYPKLLLQSDIKNYRIPLTFYLNQTYHEKNKEKIDFDYARTLIPEKYINSSYKSILMYLLIKYINCIKI